MVAHPFRVLSCFSGAGLLDLALRVAVPQSRTVCYLEIEAPAAAILVARIREGSLDDAPVWSDIATFDGSPWRGVVDCIIAGFPCTDLSLAGRGDGIYGERSGLWWELARVVREVRPPVLLLENVAAITVRGGDAVLGSLAALGYDAEWMCLRASDVGAPHRRDRWWCLAYHPSGGLGIMRGPQGLGGLPDLGREGMADTKNPDWRAESETQRGNRAGPAGHSAKLANTDGFRGGQDSNEPHTGRHISHGHHQRLADTDGSNVRVKPGRRRREDGEDEAEPRAALPLFPPARNDWRGWRQVLERWPWLAPAVERGSRAGGGAHGEGEAIAAQPGVCGVADGGAVVLDAARADQLRCAGNGVVVLQAAAAIAGLTRRVLSGGGEG